MGQAKSRRAKGDYPDTRERFKPGPVTIEVPGRGALHAWIEASGRVHRLVIGQRIRHDGIVRLVQDAARKRESRIIRPAAAELVRP